jgi:hypothetical protein
VTAAPQEDDFAPIPQASQETGVPKRTIYRWIDSKKLKTRTVEGKTWVAVSAVRALAATRDAADQPGIAGAPAGIRANGTTSALQPGSPPSLDGDLAAILFGAFEQGETPIAIVQRLRLPPPMVLAAHAQYSQLRTSTAPTAQQARVEQLELDRQAMVAELNGLMSAIGRMSSDLSALASRVEALPVPGRDKFTCACGSAGWVVAPVKCGVCGKQVDWGFQPPRQ